MKTLSVHRADAVRTRPVEPVAIHIDGTMPDALTPADAQQLFIHDGYQLAEALWEALPGGTMDQLIAALFGHRASLFRVRFPLPAKSDGSGS